MTKKIKIKMKNLEFHLKEKKLLQKVNKKLIKNLKTKIQINLLIVTNLLKIKIKNNKKIQIKKNLVNQHREEIINKRVIKLEILLQEYLKIDLEISHHFCNNKILMNLNKIHLN